jgi:non-ribosomal peptide synthetase component F
MLLLAGFSLVVAQRCDSPRVRLGTDVANRNHAGVEEEMVGFFVNQLVLQLTRTTASVANSG